jgi:hypothetical protein
VILSSLYGLQQPSVVAWMGVLVVVTATAMYGRIASASLASQQHPHRVLIAMLVGRKGMERRMGGRRWRCCFLQQDSVGVRPEGGC